MQEAMELSDLAESRPLQLQENKEGKEERGGGRGTLQSPIKAPRGWRWESESFKLPECNSESHFPSAELSAMSPLIFQGGDRRNKKAQNILHKDRAANTKTEEVSVPKQAFWHRLLLGDLCSSGAPVLGNHQLLSQAVSNLGERSGWADDGFFQLF